MPGCKNFCKTQKLTEPWCKSPNFGFTFKNIYADQSSGREVSMFWHRGIWFLTGCILLLPWQGAAGQEVPHWISCRKGQTQRNLVLTGLYYFYLDKELQDKKCLTGYLVERVRHWEIWFLTGLFYFYLLTWILGSWVSMVPVEPLRDCPLIGVGHTALICSVVFPLRCAPPLPWQGAAGQEVPHWISCRKGQTWRNLA